MAREPTREEEKTPILSKHKHIYNGGYTVSVDIYENVTFRSDCLGHIDASLMFGEGSIDWLIETLTEAKYRLKAFHERLASEESKVTEAIQRTSDRCDECGHACWSGPNGPCSMVP